MISPTYTAYLSSDHWREKRAEKIRAVGGSCERCGEDTPPIHVHHRTYKRLGREELSDLEVLCRSCHAKEHPDKLPDRVFRWRAESDCDFCPSRISVAHYADEDRIALQCIGCGHLRLEKRGPGTELGQPTGSTHRQAAVSCVACRSGFHNLYAISQHHRDKHGVPWEGTPEANRKDTDTPKRDPAPLPWWHREVYS